MVMITVVALIVAVLVLYMFLSGNGIKFKIFKKKEHKVKASKSNEEKYKDVIPKEKPEKKETQTKFLDSAKKEKIKSDIKKEISEAVGKPKEVQTAPKPAGTVTKITKEDFLKNNITLPSTSPFMEDEKKSGVVLPKAKEQPSKPYDFEIGDDDMPDPFEGIGVEDNDESDPFAGVDIDALLNSSDEEFNAFLDGKLGGAENKKSETLPLQPKRETENKFNQLDAKDYFGTASGDSFSEEKFYDGPLTNKTLGDRFEEVFGDKFREMGGTEQGKEIIVGDILSAPRSEVNKMKRIEREKRKKWM